MLYPFAHKSNFFCPIIKKISVKGMITGGFPGAMLPKTPAKGKFRREDDFFFGISEYLCRNNADKRNHL